MSPDVVVKYSKNHSSPLCSRGPGSADPAENPQGHPRSQGSLLAVRFVSPFSLHFWT